MPRKRVLGIMINSLKLGGAEKVVFTLLERYCSEYDVHLILLENRISFKIDKRVKVKIISGNASKSGKYNLIMQALTLKRYIRESNISILQSNLFRSNYVNIISKLLGSHHKVHIVDHSMPSRLASEGLSGLVHKLLIKLLYRYSDLSISVSKMVMEELQSLTMIKNRCLVINNPFEISKIIKLSHMEVTDVVFSDKFKYLISVGRINKIKDYDTIIRAINELNVQNIRWLIIGEEEDVEVSSLYNKVKNKSIIQYLGPKMNPFKYIRACDALIVSSKSESFGNVIIESMLSQTLVISSDCGGPTELLFPGRAVGTIKKAEILWGKYGILFPVGDEISLAKAIKVSLFDKASINNLMKSGVARSKKYSADAIFMQYRECIEAS